ncbi:hypothetical protein SCHIN_v1c02550 [Spiroplasma chinense]|uniref:MFS transporter n=1 Tax=Spiroplasma chinense TaxID=216932 RepID=A0A5B9Y5Z0_9MOLU|nr:hypothetical protein [Spiroplasma chinense]QEH61452.1 hypothetical protein SCHIN_v1c02550 [Spiroplasma chinense]
MKGKCYKYQSIADISVSSLFCALIITINLFLKGFASFDIGLYILAIATIFFKVNISFGIALGTSFLTLFINADPIYLIANCLSYILMWAFVILLRKVFYKVNVLFYIFILLFSVVKYMLMFTFWTIIYDAETAVGFYIVYSVEMHMLFIGYLILPILLNGKIYMIMKGIKNLNENYFNKKIKKIINDEEKEMKFSDNIKHYRIQMASLMFSIMFMAAYFTFAPYAIAVQLKNEYYAALIFLTPFIMVFAAPMWLKVKKKIGSKQVLINNWIGLFIGTVLMFTMFAIKSDNIHFTIMFLLGHIMFSIFFAGVIPVNMEMIRSFMNRNNMKTNIRAYMGFSSLLLIAPLYILNHYNLNWAIAAIFGVVGLVIIILLVVNQNIWDKPVTLDINTKAFASLKTNKKFWANVFLQNYFFGVSKFFEFGLVLMMFINIKTNKMDMNLNSFWIYISCAFLAKYLAQAFARIVKIKDEKMRSANIFGNTLILLSIVSLAIFFLLLNEKEITQIAYFAVMIGASFFIGFGGSLIDKTKTRLIKSIVKDEEYSLAMIIDHVAGHAIFSLVVSLVYLIVTLAITLTPFNLLLFWTSASVVTLIIFSFQTVLSKNINTK